MRNSLLRIIFKLPSASFNFAGVSSRVLRSEREVEVLEEGSPYFARKYRYRSGLPEFVENTLVAPFVQTVLWTSEQVRRLQTGSLHLYLAYLLATVVGLLLWAR